jgi:hypothetical protein
MQGIALVRQAAEAIGLAISTEESQARLHANGSQGGGILTTDAKLSKESVDRLRSQFGDNYAGSENAFKTKVLDSGLKFQSMMMTGVDAQHMETRRFQIEEVCRFMRVHPLKLFHGDKASTYASVEQFAISHVVDTIQPWVSRWEQALDRSLLTDADVKSGHYFHFTLQSLLRGDAASRAAYYKSGINDGWMTRNEARLFEELNPIEGLDDPLVPLNMSIVGEEPPVSAQIPALPTPGVAPEPAENEPPGDVSEPPEPPDPAENEPDPAVEKARNDRLVREISQAVALEMLRRERPKAETTPVVINQAPVPRPPVGLRVVRSANGLVERFESIESKE